MNDRGADGAKSVGENLPASRRKGWPDYLANVGSVLAKLAPTLLTLATLYFLFFPKIEALAPPELRSVTLSNVELGRRVLDPGQVRTELLFTLEAVGYEANEIGAAWERFDAVTLESLDHGQPTGWGRRFNFETRNDRAVGRMVVPLPVVLPSTRCLFVRVMVFVAPQRQGDAASAQKGFSTPEPDWVLDYADTAPFDPYEPSNPDCPSVGPPTATDGDNAS